MLFSIILRKYLIKCWTMWPAICFPYNQISYRWSAIVDSVIEPSNRVYGLNKRWPHCCATKGNQPIYKRDRRTNMVSKCWISLIIPKSQPKRLAVVWLANCTRQILKTSFQPGNTNVEFELLIDYQIWTVNKYIKLKFYCQIKSTNNYKCTIIVIAWRTRACFENDGK